MSVGRKESNNLVEKAGKAIIDLALSLSSRNAISNAACSEGMRLRNVCEYNGKLYKINLDGTREDSDVQTEIENINNLVTDARKLFDNTIARATTVTLPHTVEEDIQAFALVVNYGGASTYSGGSITIDGLNEIEFVAINANSPSFSADKTVILKKGQIINGSAIGSGSITVYKLAYKE